ncbi:MAG: hypothetical protein AAGA08_15095 [Pseudomonadota bacterium]
MVFGRLKTFALAMGVSLAAGKAVAQMPEPDKWVSMVPEGAMGTVIAMYMPSANPVLGVSLQCSGNAPWLEIGVNDAVVRQVLGELGPTDPIFFRVGTMMRQYEPYDENLAWERSERNKVRWPGQNEFIAAMFAGQPLEILSAPAGNMAALRVLGVIQGAQNDPGLAQVVAQCGDGRPAPGATQAIPKERQNWVGEWQLRARGENFPMPLAQVATMENGSTFGLFCDQQNRPAAYFGGGIAGQAAIIDAVIDGQPFAFEAVPYETHLIFYMSRAFLAALQAGRQMKMRTRGQFEVTFALNGASAGAAHAYRSCGQPVY